MIFLRKILFPFSILYGFITGVRNFLYDKGILKSYPFDVPIIAVGNLSTGGTGKSPQIEYLIRLLSDKYKIVTLSRGYKRKSKGFVLADHNASALTLGDEPFQFYKKFSNIQVAVCADRKEGIQILLNQSIKPEVILLDDAYQHRKVKAGYYILLTCYNDLYINDFILPTGNLRESSNGSQRADCIIVTKCPKNLTEEEKRKMMQLLTPKNNKKVGVFFSYIDYDENVYSEKKSEKVQDIKEESKVIVAGIARPKPFFEFLKNDSDIVLSFPDHHEFKEEEVAKILKLAQGKKIITTEKDYVRLCEKISTNQLFYLPIKSNFIENKESFESAILKFVASTSK
jgi:tetraacyldisaccharide 4'-kinase